MNKVKAIHEGKSAGEEESKDGPTAGDTTVQMEEKGREEGDQEDADQGYQAEGGEEEKQNDPDKAVSESSDEYGCSPATTARLRAQLQECKNAIYGKAQDDMRRVLAKSPKSPISLTPRSDSPKAVQPTPSSWGATLDRELVQDAAAADKQGQ